MEQSTNQILFALLRCAICGDPLTQEERSLYTQAQLPDLLKLSKKHDISHLVILGMEKSGLAEQDAELKKRMLQAAYRYERLNYEYVQLCAALEAAQIPFVPLKGSVLRKYYPEAWMRTSCDIDILVRPADLEQAVACLEKNLQYIEKERFTHDVSLITPMGNHIELHFDLVEEGRANHAAHVLRAVWENVSPIENSQYWYAMSDAFFYFYHIAHMAKHFENGGCGVRPFIDLWLLDQMDGAAQAGRDALLAAGGLLQFANAARKLSRVWLGGEEADALSLQMQAFILSGGSFGSSDNRVALQQKKKGGRLGYFLSRVFLPYEKLKLYYPVLEKHSWLMPVMQVRRWLMLLNPDVAKRAKSEIAANNRIEEAKADEMNQFLNDIGL